MTWEEIYLSRWFKQSLKLIVCRETMLLLWNCQWLPRDKCSRAGVTFRTVVPSPLPLMNTVHVCLQSLFIGKYFSTAPHGGYIQWSHSLSLEDHNLIESSCFGWKTFKIQFSQDHQWKKASLNPSFHNKPKHTLLACWHVFLAMRRRKVKRGEH